jgi:hypothetical protein
MCPPPPQPLLTRRHIQVWRMRVCVAAPLPLVHPCWAPPKCLPVCRVRQGAEDVGERPSRSTLLRRCAAAVPHPWQDAQASVGGSGTCPWSPSCPAPPCSLPARSPNRWQRCVCVSHAVGSVSRALVCACGRCWAGWCVQGDIVLVSLREYQDCKADVIMKYTAEEARELKKRKWLPDNGAWARRVFIAELCAGVCSHAPPPTAGLSLQSR